MMEEIFSVKFLVITVVFGLIQGVAGNILTHWLITKYGAKETIGTLEFWDDWIRKAVFFALPFLFMLGLGLMFSWLPDTIESTCVFLTKPHSIIQPLADYLCKFRLLPPHPIFKTIVFLTVLGFFTSSIMYVVYFALHRWISPLSKEHASFGNLPLGLRWAWALSFPFMSSILLYLAITSKS